MSPIFDSVMPLTRRFARHPNSEHEQALVRLAIELLIGLFVVWYTPFEQSSLNLLVTLSGFLLVALALLAHIAWRPQPIVTRRIVAILNDVGGVSYSLLFAGELGVPIYLFYLWITFGNGFRFGKLYLYISLGSALTGFMLVLLYVPYWRAHQSLGGALWICMVLVGLYFSTLVTRMTKALQREEAANQAKRSFISSVSHELRTPLNAIIGMANLLHSTSLNREQGDMVRSLDNASHLMLALIEDVLDFSKIEAGKLLIEHVDFDLHALVHSTLDIFTYQASARGLGLSVQVDPAAPYALRGDPHHLRQVLVNLMSNAIKFTERGHIALRIACVSNVGRSVLLRFEVEDTGIGIAPDAQHKVFESFTQADESTSRRYGGTGLGTTISRQLVELMGGRLGLRSQVGVGSTFWFELGLEKIADPPVTWLSECRLLLVNFSPMTLTEIESTLQSLGIETDAVADHHALQTVSTAGPRYTALLLAAPEAASLRFSAVPDTTLRHTVGALQRTDGTPAIPIILCDRATASCDTQQRLAQQLSLENVLPLPLQIEHLLHALHAVFVRRPVAGASDPTSSGGAGVIAGNSIHPDADRIDNAARFDVPGLVVVKTALHYRILVAEDNPTNRIVIQKMLERAGHACMLVENGEQALDAIDQDDYDAVIVDMNMPVMNGLDATRALRVMSLGRHLPIIMLSADVTAETQSECIAAGIDRFLPKPIQIDLLLEVLDGLIAQHGTVSPRAAALLRQPLIPVAPVMLQPIDDHVVLNYATLAELDAIGQDRRFVDGVIAGFVADNRQLMARLAQALQTQQLAEFRDALHAIKGCAMGIGALALRTHCALLEARADSEFRGDATVLLTPLHNAFADVLQALEDFQQQRAVNTLHKF